MFIREVDDAKRQSKLSGRGARTFRAEEGGLKSHREDIDPLFEDDLCGEEAVESSGKQGEGFHFQ
jgi:hypothetical protein